MIRRKTLRLLFVTLVVILAGFVIADSLGFFDTKPYREVSHGSHSHYVPHDRDPNVSVSDFPTQPPRKGEEITPTGQIVPVTEGDR